MIRFKEVVLWNLFIHPETGMITDANGDELEQKVNQGYAYVNLTKYVKFPCQPGVHCIQAHTKYGYMEGWDVHHLDGNPLNNDLYNLEYLPHEGHSSKTNKGVSKSENARKAISASRIGNVYPKQQAQLERMHEANKGCLWWVNKFTGEHKFQKECPGDEWVKGRKYECISQGDK